MAQRLLLQSLLTNILGAQHVYFQPPSSLRMEYPCIRYELDDRQQLHADNTPYKDRKRYQVTVIDRNPDSLIPDKVAALPLCRFDRFYTADDLNHYVFNLFF